ncbi:MAG TPA: rRNA maturation RNase YbeY [Verrucomicrobiae bacterium]|nr:rRNA maturation RNase YbeY [Verrucomicrobiae bacterium]
MNIQNIQRTKTINPGFLREIICALLNDLPGCEDYDLTVHLVGEKKMSELNETILRHAGSTDVITFDYSVAGPAPMFAGEIFVCMDEALTQARRFRTTWQSELVRYIVHGVLHLQGYDDLQPIARRRMKRKENRLVGELSREFDLRKLHRKTRVSA